MQLYPKFMGEDGFLRLEERESIHQKVKDEMFRILHRDDWLNNQLRDMREDIRLSLGQLPIEIARAVKGALQIKYIAREGPMPGVG